MLLKRPRFESKVLDVMGLYLNPLDARAAGTDVHHYKSYGTTTVFAALNTLDDPWQSARCVAQVRRLIERKILNRLSLQPTRHDTGARSHVKARQAKHPYLVMHFASAWCQVAEHGRAVLAGNLRTPHQAR